MRAQVGHGSTSRVNTPFGVWSACTRLRQSRLETLLAGVSATESIDDPASFPAQTATIVARLVPCDSVTYNEVDVAGRTVVWLADPAEATDLPDGPAIFAAQMHEHPLIAHHACTPTSGALKISDFLTLREFRSTGLYQDFFRPLSIKRQLAVTLPASSGIVIGIALDRATRDFSEEDRAVLDLLRPHLVNAQANARARSDAARTIAALERVAAADDQGVVVLDAAGRPSLVTPVAEAQLRSWWPGCLRSGRELPAALDAWVAERLADPGDEGRLGRSPQPLRLSRDDQRLVVRFLPRSTTGDPPVLLLDERRPALSPDALRALGLTRREGEVLRGAAGGASNAQIAGVLKLSPGTVKKHLEHIYGKLGVSSRGAAVARALAWTIA